MFGSFGFMRLFHSSTRWLCGLCLLIGATACTSASIATPTPVTIEIAGSTAATPVLHDLAEAFNRRHPHVVFALRGGGSTLGEQWVREGNLDLAVSTLLPPEMSEADSRQPVDPVVPQEPQQPGEASAPATVSTPASAGQTVVRIPIAMDGLAIVVHPSNPVASLSPAQLHDLYSGEILTWSTLGGAEEEVLLISREDGSGARLLFEERIMGGDSVSLTAIVMPTHTDVAAYVADHPNAIGYVSHAFVVDALYAGVRAAETPTTSAITVTGALTGAARAAFPQAVQPGKPVRVIAVAGALPTIEKLQSQQYLLVHPLYLISRAKPEGWTAQFIDFVLSPAGQEIIGRYHAPIRPSVAEENRK